VPEQPETAKRQSFQAPKGTHDVLPPESERWQALIATFAGHAERAGYGLIQQPMFEDVGVFQRLGEGTDVVRKEMYDFEDKGGRRIALRPEGTASVVRAFVEHRPPVPWKVWYAAPSFRYERAQAGRYRQHHQLGVEAIGSADPDLDVEVIALGWDHLRSLGLDRLALLLNSMGGPGDRARYLETLRSFLEQHRYDLADDDREKLADHPMRVLDSKRKATQEVVRDAPSIIDAISDEAAERFERVKAGLSALGVPFVLEPRLVRGLDYYVHTTFEIQASALESAQSTVLGGGRYDGLVEELGGPPTPGIGFGSGIERVLLACDAEGTFPLPERTTDVFVVDVTGGEAARDLVAELRRAGLRADRAWDQRAMRAQMKAADRSGAPIALIVGEQEAADGTVTVRSLAGEERTQRTAPRGDVIEHVKKELA
jgi:histidyl-tRNA synthetase